jgi:hypothetical protein
MKNPTSKYCAHEWLRGRRSLGFSAAARETRLRSTVVDRRLPPTRDCFEISAALTDRRG